MFKELVDVAERLCEGYRDMPCGCEGCPLWDLEEYEKYKENWQCDFFRVAGISPEE
jgi:hypothetical protein